MASIFDNYKTRYIVDNLSKISHKKTEHYVITAILTKLDDLRIRPVFQQFISKNTNTGRSYVDLYFPALKYGVEVYEEYHTSQVEFDNARKKQIEDAAGITLKIVNCNAQQTLATINKQIDDIVIELKYLILKKGNALIVWPDDGNDTTFEYHLSRGYLDVNECEYFRTLEDITKSFSLTETPYKGFQAKGAVKVDWLDNAEVFWPNVKSKYWTNDVNDDKTVLIETMNRPETDVERINHLNRCIAGDRLRITFLKDKDVFGNSYYTYIGNFKLDKVESQKTKSLVWRRVASFQLLKDMHLNESNVESK